MVVIMRTLNKWIFFFTFPYHHTNIEYSLDINFALTKNIFLKLLVNILCISIIEIQKRIL